MQKFGKRVTEGDLVLSAPLMVVWRRQPNNTRCRHGHRGRQSPVKFEKQYFERLNCVWKTGAIHRENRGGLTSLLLFVRFTQRIYAL